MSDSSPDGGQSGADGGGGGGGDGAAGDSGPQECGDGWTGAACDVCVTFVDGESGSDDDPGLTWGGAVATVQAGIEAAEARLEADDVETCSVWIRAGVYLPGSERSDSFVLAPGVHLYGGFDGGETSRSERDWEANATVLSGDLAQNDEPDNADTLTDNAYHVVIGADAAVLDGFTVTAGNADADTSPDDRAGGLRNDSASPTVSRVIFTGNGVGVMYNYGTSAPTLTEVTFSDNEGLAMYNTDQSAPVLNDVTFSGNSGGGVSNAGDSAPQLTNVTFSDNTGVYGGGISNRGSSTTIVTNAIFTGNSANAGGAIYHESSAVGNFTNVVVAGNSASSDGGAAFNRHTSVSTFTNTTFYANSAGDVGGAMENRATVEIRNSIFWDNEAVTSDPELHVDSGTTSISHSIVEGGQPTGVADDDWVLSSSGNPLFVDTPDDLRLLPSSPGVDAGNSLLSDLPDMDLAGEPRITDGDGDGDDAIDIGAYEYQP